MNTRSAISEYDLIITLLVGIIIFILLASFIITYVVFYNKRKAEFKQKINKLEYNFQQELLKAQLEVQEQTLQKVSQDIHDNIGQVLTLIKLNLSKVLLNHRAKNEDKIKDSKDLVTKAIKDLRNLSKSLNNEGLQEIGLAKAIAQELSLIEKTGGFQVTFTQNGDYQCLDQQEELIVFRMVQETLNNVIKHADAKTIDVRLEYTDPALRVTVKDDGIGFNLLEVLRDPELYKGIGLRNMYRRAQLIGAAFNISSTKENGTTVSIEVPIKTRIQLA